MKKKKTKRSKTTILKTNCLKDKILIVDDELINLQLLSNILESSYHVYKAINYSETIKIAIADTPDLILLDIIMPEINGYEVCLKLKDNTQTAHIPIIFLTSKNKEKDEEDGFKVGAVDFITKPFRPLIDMQRIAVHIKLAKKYNSALNLKNQQQSNKNDKFFGLELEIKKLYNFTDAEARLSNGLVNGQTLEEIANEWGIAYSTLRGYLRNIFFKTNTKKQHELVSSIMTSLIFWNQAGSDQ